MSGHYKRLGIEFLYPENWQLADEETSSWPRAVSVHSPGGGFWSLLVYDEGEPAELVAGVQSALEAEYDEVESTELTVHFDQFELRGREMFFYCLDFVVNARAIAVEAAGQIYLLVWQAEDTEFQQLESVFHAISTSLFRGVADSLAARASGDRAV